MDVNRLLCELVFIQLSDVEKLRYLPRVCRLWRQILGNAKLFNNKPVILVKDVTPWRPSWTTITTYIIRYNNGTVDELVEFPIGKTKCEQLKERFAKSIPVVVTKNPVFIQMWSECYQLSKSKKR